MKKKKKNDSSRGHVVNGEILRVKTDRWNIFKHRKLSRARERRVFTLTDRTIGVRDGICTVNLIIRDGVSMRSHIFAPVFRNVGPEMENEFWTILIISM